MGTDSRPVEGRADYSSMSGALLMNTTTGFSMPYHTLSVSLRIAFIDYLRFLAELGNHGDWIPENFESHESLEARAITVVLLSAAVCESTINSYLGMNLEAEIANPNDRRSPVAKWRNAPRQYFPEYKIPEESQLNADLVAVFGSRNYLMHARSDIFVGEEKVQAGNHDAMKITDHNHLKRIYRLPVTLLENLEKYDFMGATRHRTPLAMNLFVTPPNPPVNWFSSTKED
jgi:hypothetical protein